MQVNYPTSVYTSYAVRGSSRSEVKTELTQPSMIHKGYSASCPGECKLC